MRRRRARVPQGARRGGGAGLRTSDGTEFGVGPNVTPAGVALAFAFGVTLRAGIMNVPMNIAVVPSKAGTRVSFLTGFNMRRR